MTSGSRAEGNGRGNEAAEKRRSTWTCSDCEVVVRYLAGFEAPVLPRGWADEGRGLLCLSCRRHAFIAEHADGTGQGVRRALVEFELRRDPDRDDRVIAKAAGSSRGVVVGMRRDLLVSGVIERRQAGPRRVVVEVPPGDPTGKTATVAVLAAEVGVPERQTVPPAGQPKVSRREKRERVEAALRANPLSTDLALARATATTAPTVCRVRHVLEAEGSIPTCRRGKRLAA